MHSTSPTAESRRQRRRVMLLSSARTGSNWLLSLLSAHPSIKTYGEVFNLDALPSDSLREALDDPTRYLRMRLGHAQRREVTAVVFKMFYYHLRPAYFERSRHAFYALHHLQDRSGRVSASSGVGGDWSAFHDRWRLLWDWLIADDALDVLHLERGNMLDTLVSMKAAHETDRWWKVSAGHAAEPTVRLNPEQCAQYFEELETLRAEADRAFAAHRRLTMTYEEMVARRDESLSRIFAFLDVPCRRVSSRMQKQRVTPTSQLVENYDELRESFRGTKWRHFFEPCGTV